MRTAGSSQLPAVKIPVLVVCGKGSIVANHTIHEAEVHSDTAAFVCLEPRVAALVIDVIYSIGSILNWRRGSVSFACEVLRRLGGESVDIEIGHAAFAKALFPALAEEAGKVKVSRLVAHLKEDQALSRFAMVWVISNRRHERPDGSFISLPTLYRNGEFWVVFREVQERVKDCDLMALSLAERRARLRVILSEILAERGCTAVARLPKTGKAKKPATVSEAAGAVEPERSEERVTKADIEARLEAMQEEFVTLGTQGLNMGLKLPILDAKINAAATGARVRLKAALKRANDVEASPQTAARVKGRMGLEMALEGLRMVIAAAEEMAAPKYVEWFGRFVTALSNVKLFREQAAEDKRKAVK